jgi:SpoVK/Ycf46/Vps4 family AAA+-type ATPase
MTLAEDVNLEEFVMAKDELSGADIKAVCTEAGLLALRERRMRVTQVGGGGGLRGVGAGRGGRWLCVCVCGGGK